jgi:hypothetical protein
VRDYGLMPLFGTVLRVTQVGLCTLDDRRAYPRITTLAVLPLSLGLGACSDICSNTEVARSTSPDGRFDAVLFQRDCGATTGFSSQISLVAAGENIDSSSPLYRADDDHGAAQVGAWGGPWTEAKWIAADKLLVRYAERSRIFEQDEYSDGISVSYQVAPLK